MGWYQDAETGEYFQSDSTPEGYDTVGDPYQTEAGWDKTLARSALGAVSGVAKGVSGLGSAFGDFIQNNARGPGTQGFGSAISDFFDQNTRDANNVDAWAAQQAPLNEGSWKSRANNIISAGLPAVGVAAASGGAGIVAPAVTLGMQYAGQKYNTLKDQGLPENQALLDAVATGGVQTAANMIPFGAIVKGGGGSLMSEMLKRTAGGAVGNVLGSVVGQAGDVAVDSALAPENVPKLDKILADAPNSLVDSALIGGLMGGAATFSPGNLRARRLSASDALAAKMQAEANQTPAVEPLQFPAQDGGMDAFNTANASLFTRDRTGRIEGDMGPQPQLRLPAPESVIGDNFTARDLTPEEAARSAATLYGPDKVRLPQDGVVLDSTTSPFPDPGLVSARPDASKALVVDKFGGDPRTEQDVRDSINLRAGATGLDNPVLNADGAPVDSSKLPAPQPIVKPFTKDGSIRQSLTPEETSITDYITREKDATIEQRAREDAQTAQIIQDSNVEAARRESPPNPIVKAPDSDNWLAKEQPRISTDTSNTAIRQAKKFRDANGKLSSEAGAITLPFTQKAAIEKAIREEAKPSAIRSEYESPIGKYFQWNDTMAAKHPEAKQGVDAITNAGEDSNVLKYNSYQTLKPLIDMQGDPLVQTYLNKASELGASFQHSAQKMASYGMNEKQIAAVEAARSQMKGSAERIAAFSIEQANHTADMAAINAKWLLDAGQITPEAFREKINVANKVKSESIAQAKATQQDWERSNYSPQNRYGKYRIDIIDPKTNQIVDTRMTPSKKEMVQIVSGARKEGMLAKPSTQPERPDATYRGISPDVLTAAGKSDGYAIEGYARHRVQRKGIPGYDPDTARAWMEHAQGEAKMLSFGKMDMELDKWAASLPRDTATDANGKLKNPTAIHPDYIPAWQKVMEARKGLSNPKSPFFKALSKTADLGFLAMQMRAPLGDQMAMFQRMYPEVGKWTGGKAELVFGKSLGVNGSRLFMSDAQFAKTYGNGLAKTIKEAEARGIIQGTAQKRLDRGANGASGVLSKLDDAAFWFKHQSDRFADANGVVAGWYAYPHAKAELAKQGLGNMTQGEFALKFARDVRPNPDNAILPGWMKNDLADSALKYKKWQLSSFRAMKNAASSGDWAYLTRALGMTVASAGITGLPFASTVDQALKLAGVDAKKALRDFLSEKMGDSGGSNAKSMNVADNIIYGPASVAAGVNLSHVAGMGDTIPGVDTTLNDFIAGLGGVPVGLANNLLKAGQLAKQGRYGRAAEKLPVPLLNNYMKLKRWSDEGVVTESGQGLVPKSDVSSTMLFKQALGLQPLEVAKKYEENASLGILRNKEKASVNQNVGELLARGDKAAALQTLMEAVKRGEKPDLGQIQHFKAKFEGDPIDRLKGFPVADRPEAAKILRRGIKGQR